MEHRGLVKKRGGEERVLYKDDGKHYLQGDELLEDPDAFAVSRVLLDVGVSEERLEKMETG